MSVEGLTVTAAPDGAVVIVLAKEVADNLVHLIHESLPAHGEDLRERLNATICEDPNWMTSDENGNAALAIGRMARLACEIDRVRVRGDRTAEP